MKNIETATTTPATTTRILAENLAGNTLDGQIEVTIKRHTLKGESKCAMIKRLLCTAGMTREVLIAQVEAAHGPLKDSTLNTIRADLKRTLGGLVVCKGWRTDEKLGKLATAAVAKLRTAQLGEGYASVGLVVSQPAAPVEAPVEATTEAQPDAAEAQVEVTTPEAKPASKKAAKRKGKK